MKLFKQSMGLFIQGEFWITRVCSFKHFVVRFIIEFVFNQLILP
jgi:hypothetical protein